MEMKIIRFNLRKLKSITKVPLNQEGNIITYTFTVSPTSIKFPREGGTRTLSIVSTKSSSNGNIENLGYSYKLSGGVIESSYFSFSGSTVTAKNYSGSIDLQSTLTLTQNKSGKTVTINLSYEEQELLPNRPVLKSEKISEYSTRYYLECRYPVTSDLKIEYSGVHYQFPEEIPVNGTTSISIGSTVSETIYTSNSKNSSLIINRTVVTPSQDSNYIYN